MLIKIVHRKNISILLNTLRNTNLCMNERENCLKRMKQWNWKSVIGVVLFISLVISIGYTIIKIAITPEQVAPDSVPREDYILMLLQCSLGLALMALPSFIAKKFSLEIPNYMYVLFFIFLYCSIYLGEVHRFFYRVHGWDSILHAFSGVMLGTLGFALVSIINDAHEVNVHLSPLFVALFALCFAIAAGTIWEIYEFSIDFLAGMNMQKYRLADGTLLVGQAALMDSMKDLIIDTVSALLVVVVGYFSIKKKRVASMVAQEESEQGKEAQQQRENEVML